MGHNTFSHPPSWTTKEPPKSPTDWVVLAVFGSEHCTLELEVLFVIYGISAMIAFPVSYIAILAHWPKDPRSTSGIMTTSILGYGIAMVHSFVTGPWPTIFSRHSYHFSGIYIGFLIEAATVWCNGVASIMAEKFSK
ncbi:hypothetical protein CFIO01_04970 [Colletotrichum fioriniae PJ7]|uniref:Uncharacterized protein n=1 Tax=Colletotrichum fioriniae PJ7 TaxID=1445577 RepID=A0A010QFH8_9PEZI|nr:hypothetical protein CFIO01_04970 [Colletotrichum fioriniae PJ7]